MSGLASPARVRARAASISSRRSPARRTTSARPRGDGSVSGAWAARTYRGPCERENDGGAGAGQQKTNHDGLHPSDVLVLGRDLASQHEGAARRDLSFAPLLAVTRRECPRLVGHPGDPLRQPLTVHRRVRRARTLLVSGGWRGAIRGGEVPMLARLALELRGQRSVVALDACVRLRCRGSLDEPAEFRRPRGGRSNSRWRARCRRGRREDAAQQVSGSRTQRQASEPRVAASAARSARRSQCTAVSGAPGALAVGPGGRAPIGLGHGPVLAGVGVVVGGDGQEVLAQAGT